MTAIRHDVPCPMSGCEGVLYLTWTVGYGLFPDDVKGDAGLQPEVDAHTQSWQVECTDGHVLLLPGYPGCGCDDPEASSCLHDEDDYDWGDDTRTFRRHDMDRLRELLATMGASEVTHV